MGNGVLPVINPATVPDFLHLERNKYRKGFGSEGAERIDFPRADGEHGIQPVKLLELEGGKLAHMLAGNRKHRLRVAVKLLLAVGAKHHCNQAEHHALVAGGEVV